MRLKWLLVAVISCSSALAQPGQPLPSSLPQLATILPSLVHAKTFQLGPFSDAVDDALRKDLSSAPEAVKICAKNLGDSDPQVRVHTLFLLYAIAMTPQGPVLLKPVDNQIAQILLQEDDTSQKAALLISSILGLRQSVPDSFVAPLEQLVQAPGASEGTRAGAATALVMARPTDPGAQQMIVNIINDTSQTRSLRSGMIHATRSPYVGTTIGDCVVRIANTETDKALRDEAISAVTQIGPAAVERIRDRIMEILRDSTESDSSRLTASQAFQRLQ